MKLHLIFQLVVVWEQASWLQIKSRMEDHESSSMQAQGIQLWFSTSQLECFPSDNVLMKDEGLLKPKGSQSLDLAPSATTCLESHHPNPWVGDRKSSFQREVQSSVHSGDIVSGPTDKPTCSSLEGLKPYFHSSYFWPEFEPHLCTESSVILKTCLLLVTKNTEMRDSPIPRRSECSPHREAYLSVPRTLYSQSHQGSCRAFWSPTYLHLGCQDIFVFTLTRQGFGKWQTLLNE